MTQKPGKIVDRLVEAIVDADHICISTELKWRSAEYGFYHDESARAADASTHVETDMLPAAEYPRLEGKRIYKSRRNPPSTHEITSKALAYDAIMQIQSENHKCGLFAQAVLTVAFWKAAIELQPILHRLPDKIIMGTRPTYYIQGRVPEIDIYFALSRSHYAIDVKNKLEMITPDLPIDSKTVSQLIGTWAGADLNPLIAAPLTSKRLKSQLLANRGRSYDYINVILLEDQDAQQAFETLHMTAVRFLPKITVGGDLCDGREFFSVVAKLLEREQPSLAELVSHIDYDNPTLTELVSKCKGLFVLFTLYNQMENTMTYGSKTDAMKRGVDYLIYQYVCAAQTSVSLDALTFHARSQRYLPALQLLEKSSIQESRKIVEESSHHLESLGLTSLNSDQLTCIFGRRPEEFLRMQPLKLKADYGLTVA